MNVTPLNLRYVLCPGSMPSMEFSSTYQSIYRCWRETWDHAFSELKYDRPYASDSFTRQDYVGALMMGDSCIALSFFRFMDASRPEFEMDSYFSNWMPEHRRALRSRGDSIIVEIFQNVVDGEVMKQQPRDVLHEVS